MTFASKRHRFGKKTATLAKKLANLLKHAKFDENFEVRERCKGVHCVDLGESLPTSIFLQNLVSIQLKTSPETSQFDFRITKRFDFPMVYSPARRGLARTGVPRGQRPSDVCATEIADFECRIADGHWPLGERLFHLHQGGTSPLLLPGLDCLRVLRRSLLLQ